MSSDHGGSAESTAGARASPPDDYGTLYVVGIGPGLPHDMTQRASDVIRSADSIVASNLYQTFLRKDGTLPPQSAAVENASDDGEVADEDGTVLERPDGRRQTLIRS